VLRVGRAVALCLGTVLLLVGAVAGVVHHEVLDADRFAAHADAVRTDPDVARELGVLLTDRLLEEQPDLVAYRPLIETAATALVSSRTIGPLVRSGLAPLYDTLVLGEPDPTVLRLADVAAVLVAAVTALAPRVAVAVPPDLDVRLSDVGAGDAGADLVGAVHLVRVLSWLAPLLGVLVLGAPAVLSRGDRRLRRALGDLGRGTLGAGLLLAALLVIGDAVAGRGDPETLAGAVRRAAWDELAPSFWLAAAGTAAIGVVLAAVGGALAGGSRPTLAAGLSMALGMALLVDPARVATALLWVTGAGLVVGGAVALLVILTHTPAARVWAVGAATVLLVGVAIGAWPDDHHLTASGAAASAACNGHVELCDRRYDEVAFPATHNSMAAASEPGWFFAEQPDGIVDQLDAGVRVLLVDSWYGRRTGRSGIVSTVHRLRARAMAEATAELGAAAVRSALRLEGALGLAPRGPATAYLCHNLCELGATPWGRSLADLRTWLDGHPREVVTLFVQDEVSPADTAALFEQAGLLPDVHIPSAEGTWPTLREMIESGRRLVVLMENHGGGPAHPWLMQGFDLVQDTPYLFRSPAALIDGAGTCAPNRGAADAPLLLVNHWVTDDRAEVSNAARVNARDVLGARVAACRRERGMLPNFVAVDFYDRGDLFGVVNDLNGLG
jgi:hypothetical protein